MGYQLRVNTKSSAKGGGGSFLRLIGVNRKAQPYRWRIYKKVGEAPAEKELTVLPPTRPEESWPQFLQSLGLKGQIFVFHMGGTITLGWYQKWSGKGRHFDMKPQRVGLVKLVWKGYLN